MNWFDKSKYITYRNDINALVYYNYGAFLKILPETESKNSIACICAVCKQPSKYKKSDLKNGNVQLCNECDKHNLKIGTDYRNHKVIDIIYRDQLKKSYIRFKCLSCGHEHQLSVNAVDKDPELKKCSKCGYVVDIDSSVTPSDPSTNNTNTNTNTKQPTKMIPKPWYSINTNVNTKIDSNTNAFGEYCYVGNVQVKDDGKIQLKAQFICKDCGAEVLLPVTQNSNASRVSVFKIPVAENFYAEALQQVIDLPHDILLSLGLKSQEDWKIFYNNLYVDCADHIYNIIRYLEGMLTIKDTKSKKYNTYLSKIDAEIQKCNEKIYKLTSNKNISIRKQFFLEALTDKKRYSRVFGHNKADMFICSKHRNIIKIIDSDKRFELKSRNDWKDAIINNLKITNRVSVSGSNIPYVSVKCITCGTVSSIKYRLDVLLDRKDVCCPYCGTGNITFPCTGNHKNINGKDVTASMCKGCNMNVSIRVKDLYNSGNTVTELKCRKDFKTVVNPRYDLLREKLKSDIAFENMANLVNNIGYKEDINLSDGSVLKKYDTGYTASTILDRNGNEIHSIRLDTYLCTKHTRLLTLSEDEANNYCHEFCFDPRMRGCNKNHP